MQAAFASAGIWIPRDAYQQEAFTQPITFHRDPLDFSSLLSGDLIFFGTPKKPPTLDCTSQKDNISTVRGVNTVEMELK
ncbi:NLP/P60 [Planktothrix tepida]|uniref:hypothetical protein n=1 Tax=Planktothrix tepida TaxID=1678309 RepID=UPI00220E1B97|nr:NLP/P60 [Planktothrix tepida]